MKRFLLIFVLMSGFIVEANAVLKEKDLEQTLAILQAELEQYNNELTVRSAIRKERAKQLITNLLLTMKQADQNALMLYSQDQTHLFDMTYACKEATKQYREFHRRQIPFTEFLERNSKELARYDSLVKRLETMPDMMTTQYGVHRRDSCLVLARNIRNMLAEGDQIALGRHHITRVECRALHGVKKKSQRQILLLLGYTCQFDSGPEGFPHCYGR